MLQLQPDAEQRVLQLTAEARSREAMFEYLRRLAAAADRRSAPGEPPGAARRPAAADPVRAAGHSESRHEGATEPPAAPTRHRRGAGHRRAARLCRLLGLRGQPLAEEVEAQRNALERLQNRALYQPASIGREDRREADLRPLLRAFPTHGQTGRRSRAHPPPRRVRRALTSRRGNTAWSAARRAFGPIASTCRCAARIRSCANSSARCLTTCRSPRWKRCASSASAPPTPSSKPRYGSPCTCVLPRREAMKRFSARIAHVCFSLLLAACASTPQPSDEAQRLFARAAARKPSPSCKSAQGQSRQPGRARGVLPAARAALGAVAGASRGAAQRRPVRRRGRRSTGASRKHDPGNVRAAAGLAQMEIDRRHRAVVAAAEQLVRAGKYREAQDLLRPGAHREPSAARCAAPAARDGRKARQAGAGLGRAAPASPSRCRSSCAT